MRKGDKLTKKQEKAKIILEALSERAPININWNFEKQFIAVIVSALDEIEKKEKQAYEL